MPPSYTHDLEAGAAAKPGDVRPTKAMSWTFYGGTVTKDKPSRENFIFFFCTKPGVVTSMLPDIDLYTDQQRAQIDEWAKAMEKDYRKVILGQERLDALHKRVGEKITVVNSFNYPGIELEVEIIGALPAGRYGQVGVMNSDYFYHAILDDYPRQHNGAKHPLADKCLNLVFLRVPSMDAFNKVAEQVEKSPGFTDPAVKVETESSGVAAFLESYKGLLNGVRYLATPAMLLTMVVIIATAISIGVRERRKEIAVLKVLGFGPGRILAMVLVEACWSAPWPASSAPGCTTSYCKSAWAASRSRSPGSPRSPSRWNPWPGGRCWAGCAVWSAVWPPRGPPAASKWWTCSPRRREPSAP